MHFKLEILGKDWIALGLTAFLMATHWLVPQVRRIRNFPDAWITSFGGGFTVAYVFLILLPSFEASRLAIGALLQRRYGVNPLLDMLVYFTSLLGFLVYFGLRRIAEKRRRLKGPPDAFVFDLRLASLALMNFIVTYTMATRVEIGLGFALFFTVVMALYVFILDRNLEEQSPRPFDRQGRFWLVGALLAGWVLSTLTEPNNILLIAMLASFLAGSVLFNVFRNEIPADGSSDFGGFVAGIAVGSLLLALLIAVEGTLHP